MRALALALALLCLALPALADSYRFDMGPDGSPLAAGYVRVTPATTLGQSPDFGWTARPMTALFRNDLDNPFFATMDTAPDFALYSDGVLSLEENSFVFRVLPGRYAVTAVIGDLAIGEGRPGNSLWANGQLIAKDEVTEANVKAFTFPVEAPEGKITLRFRADSSQKYVTVNAVSAEPLAAGQDCPVGAKVYPPSKPAPEVYRQNWARFQEQTLADWELAKRALAAEGVNVGYWQKQMAALRTRPDYREYWGWGLGSGAWERVAAITGELPLGPLCAMYREMGLDGFTTRSGLVARELAKAGMKHAVGGSAENYPAPLTGVTLNLMRNADGTTRTIPNVWSNCSPEAIATFRDLWRRMLSEAAPGAEFFVIDEPRGMWYAGSLGDYSPPAQALFKRWAAEQGYADLAARGIPEPGRTWDFYRFYQFRLNSVALFAEAFVEDTPVARVPTMPGNGDCGPEQMNHNNLWPPAFARRGMWCATWTYGEPASGKMHAETLRIAQEFGGKTAIVPPLYPEEHTALQDQPRDAACLSALNSMTLPWHFRGPSIGPNRPEWMKTVFLAARLSHATAGLAHTPPLYVWCPESLVFNDVVEFNSNEAQNWKKVWQTLSDANLDYAVTNALAVPKGSLLLYACAQPVLTPEEFGRLRQFVARGGTVLCAFEGEPQEPDGKALAGWGELPATRVVRLPLAPEALEAQVARAKPPRNWAVTAPALKTYRYVRAGKAVHLLNNTSVTEPVTVKLPRTMVDLLNGGKLAAGKALTLRPGGHALLGE